MAIGKKRLVEHNALVQAIEMGKPFEEIKQKFGIKNSTQLKLAYISALIALGKVVKPPTLSRGKKKKPVDSKVTVNSRGNLVIPKALVDELGVRPDIHFEVQKSPDGLSIEPAQERPKTLLRKRSG